MPSASPPTPRCESPPLRCRCRRLQLQQGVPGREADAKLVQLPRWRSRTSFGSAYGEIITEAPTDWDRRAPSLFGVRDYLAARWLAVAKVRAFTRATRGEL